MADLPPVDDELMASLVAVAETLAVRSDHADVARRLEWIIDTMILRGQLPKSFRRLIAKVGMERTTVRLSQFRDKYAVWSEPIDCASRVHLCHAKCCTFDVLLSAQDLAERTLPFQVDQPYVMPKADDGNCACIDGERRCTVWSQRPGVCRAYDCRHDARVWKDFDAMIPADA